MSKKLQNFKSKFINLTAASMFALTTLSGAAPLFFSDTAFAASNGDVWITAAMPNPSPNGPEYVVLKNVSDSDVNLDGWTVTTSSPHVIDASKTLASGASATICDDPTKDAATCDSGYHLGLVLPNDDTTILLTDASNHQIDQVSYAKDQTSTKGQLVTFTHTSAAALTAGDFATWDNSPSFKGINVGFFASNFGEVSAVKVDVTRADGSHVIKTARKDMLDLLSDKTSPTSASAPIIIQPGTYDETTDTYWAPQTYTGLTTTDKWDTSTKPTGATVTVTGNNGSKSVTLSTLLENDASHPAYSSMVSPTAPSNLRFTQGSKTLNCNYQGTNVLTSGTLHWTAPTGSIDQYIVSPNYPDNSGEYTFYPTGSATSAWVTGNFPSHGQGIYSWMIRAKGANGMAGPAATCYVIYDTHSPTASFTTEPPHYANGNFEVSGEAHDNVKLKSVGFDVRDPHDTTGNSWRAGCVSGTLDVNYTADGKDANFKCQINAASARLKDGQVYKIRVHVGDYSNYGGGESRDLTIDRNIPTAKITYPASGQYVNTLQHSGLLTIKGTANDTNFSYYYCWVMNSSGQEVGTRASLCGTNYSPVVNGVLGSLVLSGQPDGNYRVALVARDEAGNVAPQVTVPFVLDNTKPTIEFSDPSPADGDNVNGDFKVSFQAHDNNKLNYVSVGLRDNSNPDIHKRWKAGCNFNNLNQSDVTETCTVKLPTNLSDGTYTIQIGGQDQAGLWTVNKSRTIHVDRTAPATPTLYRPADGSLIRGSDAMLKWNAVTDPEGNGPVTYQYESSLSKSVDTTSNAFTNLRYGPVSTGDSSQIDATHSSDATYYWQVRACDSLGNCSSWSGPWRVTIDSTRPVVSDFRIDNSPLPTVFGQQIDVSAVANDAHLSKVTFYVTAPENRSGQLVCTGNGTHLSEARGALSGGRYAASLNTSAFNGSYCISVVAEDGALNHNSPFGRQLVEIDNTAPTVPALVAPSGQSFTNDNTPTFNWTGSNDTFRYQIQVGTSGDTRSSDGAFRSADLVEQINTKDSDYTFSNPNLFQPLTDGTYYWHVRARDAAGNWSDYSTARAFIVDTHGPSSTNDLPALVSGAVTVHQTVTDDTAPAAGKLRIWKLDSAGQPDNSKFYASAPMNVDANGVVTYIFDSVKDLFGDGTYIAKFTSWDKAGNGTVQQATFTVDNTAPTVDDNTFDVSMKTGDTVTLNPTVTDNSPLTYLWSLSDDKLKTNANEAMDGSSLVIGNAPAGSYIATLTVTDQAGNATTKTYNVTVVNGSVDNNNPAKDFSQQSVLGLFTKSDSGSSDTGSQSDTPAGDDQGVKGDSIDLTTQKSGSNESNSSNGDQTKSSAFFAQSWLWAVVAVVILLLAGLLYGRRRATQEQNS